MPSKSPLNNASHEIKAALIKLDASSTMTNQQLSDWLKENHQITVGKSAVNRFLSEHKKRYKGLISIGISPAVIADNMQKLESLSDLILVNRLSGLSIQTLEQELLISLRIEDAIS